MTNNQSNSHPNNLDVAQRLGTCPGSFRPAFTFFTFTSKVGAIDSCELIARSVDQWHLEGIGRLWFQDQLYNSCYRSHPIRKFTRIPEYRPRLVTLGLLTYSFNALWKHRNTGTRHRRHWPEMSRKNSSAYISRPITNFCSCYLIITKREFVYNDATGCSGRVFS